MHSGKTISDFFGSSIVGNNTMIFIPKIFVKTYNCKCIYHFSSNKALPRVLYGEIRYLFLNRQLPEIIDVFLVNLQITVLPYIDSSHIRNFQLGTIKKSKMESITNLDTVLLTRLLSEMPWDLRKFQIEHSHGCCWM